MSDITWPSVSVIMPVLNEEAHLERAVRSILSQDYPGALDVCLALGPSIDATDRLANAFATSDSRVHVVANPTGGRSSGINAAIRATAGRIIVRVDAHSALPAGYITRAVETMQRTKAVNVGGIQRAVGRTPFETTVALALASPFGMGGARYRTGGTEGAVDTVFLGVFDRAAVERIGLFDESVVGNEDYELNIRLRATGGTVWFDPELRVDYTPRASLQALAHQFFMYGAWKRAVVRKHPGSTRLRQVAPPLALLAVVASFIASPWLPIALVVPGTYALAVVAASLVASRHPAHITRLLVIFPTMHGAWAWGFLRGGPRRSPEPCGADR